MADYKAKGLAKQHSKVLSQAAMNKADKRYYGNSGHCIVNFTIQLIFFLHVVYCSVSFT